MDTSSPPDTPKGHGRGSFLPLGSAQPSVRRTVAFVDGQNLFHSARAAFGFTYPNYDPALLAQAVCAAKGWSLEGVRFYTGIPDAADNAFWNRFWIHKLEIMARRGVHVFSRRLQYRHESITLPDGSRAGVLVGEEKGIDVRIAIDVIRMGHHGEYDVALVFSQDQDLSEVAVEVRTLAAEQGRWIKVASAFPFSPTARSRRGIDKTDWIPIDRATYDACLDRRDYR